MSSKLIGGECFLRQQFSREAVRGFDQSQQQVPISNVSMTQLVSFSLGQQLAGTSGYRERLGNIAVRRRGKCLFWQWTWGKGLKPTEQRTSDFGDQRVAVFDSTAQAAYFYVLNVNTERAYRDLRLKRADLRRQKQRISDTVLAETLLHYSERGQGYVNDLEALIRENRLDGVDDAYLRRMAVIHIVPAEPK